MGAVVGDFDGDGLPDIFIGGKVLRNQGGGRFRDVTEEAGLRHEIKGGSGAPPHKAPADPLADAEEALKRLRAHPNDKQAADTLERALRQLKEREKRKTEDATKPAS